MNLVSILPRLRPFTFDRLHQQRYIQYHKKRTCASINPSHKEEVREFLSGHVADYILELR